MVNERSRSDGPTDLRRDASIVIQIVTRYVAVYNHRQKLPIKHVTRVFKGAYLDANIKTQIA